MFGQFGVFVEDLSFDLVIQVVELFVAGCQECAGRDALLLSEVSRKQMSFHLGDHAFIEEVVQLQNEIAEG